MSSIYLVGGRVEVQAGAGGPSPAAQQGEGRAVLTAQRKRGGTTGTASCY